MRKRLIEKFTKSKEGSLGYTLTELLVVIAIIAIVVAIAIPSVIAISRALKFKRVNDHAKSIFLAAQQNLSEMRSDGGLKPLQEAGGAVLTGIAGFPEEFKTEYVYTTQGTTAFELILPAGSVDGTVRSEQIIIEYNPITGNVYSVFYSEEDESILGGYQSATGLPRDDKAARKDMMLGYYDGSGLNSSQLELEKTQASVEFINGEEGIVRVLVPVPDDFFSSVDKYAQALEINLTVTGEYSMVKAAENPPAENEEAPVISFSLPIKDSTTGLGPDCYVEYGNTIVVEYPIDSLVNMGSFANHSSNTYNSKALTEQMDETGFSVLPGENITIQADVTVDTAVSEVQVKVDSGILSGVNPMFEYLQPSGSGGYVLAVANGRNLQNLNAIAPTIAEQVDSVVFTADIYWNDTVSYYNDTYGVDGATYTNAASENPARALPYFVPIHNEGLFGTAKFIFPGEGDGGLGGILGQLLEGLLNAIFGGYSNADVPTLTDEMDTVTGVIHATIQGNGHKVYNLNIDSTRYVVPNVGEKGSIKNPDTDEYVETDLTGKFYATGENQIIDYCFTGLFGYVNTPIDDLHVVNPIVKGHEFTKETTVVQNYIYIFGIPFPIGTSRVNLYNNPATGALTGAGGFNTLITNCSTYIDKDARGYVASYLGHGTFNKDAVQTWYGVSGEGAVGGLVGYAKSHRTVTGTLTNDKAVLAFADCFAAVPVSGNMRGTSDKDFGYSNGVGAFIGNSQLTNFYNCYASGDVKATGCRVNETLTGSLANLVGQLFGMKLDLLYDGRTSMGAGGFVGTSHGTRYSNCFATGDVTATAIGSSRGAGGFVGFMSIDETFAYGNDVKGDTEIAQRTVFTNCYSVGTAVTNSSALENFSGGNGRIAYSINQSITYIVGDYYRLYAPYYAREGTAPLYGESTYIYRDTYYLNYGRAVSGGQDSSSTCAEPESYETLQNLPGAHTYGSDWSNAKLAAIKNVSLSIFGNNYPNYDQAYFQRVKGLDEIYLRLYDEGYSATEWGPATAATTHPYTVSAGGAVYPFSKLVGMDYYGDWPSKPSDMGMAYYEQYVGNDDQCYYVFDKERYVVDEDGVEDTRLTLKNGETVMVRKDGYAIFSASKKNLTVTVGSVTDTLVWNGEQFTIEGKTYYAFILSDKLMAAMPAEGAFYVQVRANHADSISYTMYFNPSVAMSHVNPMNGATAAQMPDAAPKTIYVRSARQFKALATLDDFWGENYSYIQQLNIDASKYEGWDADDREVGSIGDATKPFNASYSAGYTVVGDIAKQYKLTGFQFADNASGFFGVIGNNGSIENLIVECAAPSVGGNTVSDVAVLAGRNQGTISNVDMTITGTATLTSQDNAGLLAGYSSGTIRNCEVTAAAVTVNAKNGGGLIGSAVGTANAKAVVSGCKLTLTGDLTVTGANNAGGLIGHSSHLTLSANEPLVTLTNMTANGAYAGGLAGYLENSEIKITDTANAVTVTASSVKNANGYAAGVLGGGKTVTLNGVDINAGTVEGKVAAGFLGTGADIDATYCDVVITNSVKGEEKAAGVAGTIGAQSVFGYTPVTLNNVTVSASAGDAAGYAVEIAKEANVMNSNVTLGGTAKIQASGNAAGYACTVAGYVGNTTGSTVLTSVVGKGGISGNNAAGFACDITGQVSGAFVTPALDSSKYLGNSNDNLTVTGTTSAAGFALSVGADATVTNCYALNKLVCADASGFVATNKGTINGCMANVTITGGSAFVKTNEGTVSRCYGWYGDGDETNATTTKAEVGGKCFSAYFADLNPVDKEGDIVTLYTADGTVQVMSATALQGAADVLANANNKWYTTGYNSYPYTNKSEAMPNYLYPMLRDHFGDWITPPQYAYGVAYYETYEVTASAAETAAADVAEAAETTTATTATVVKLHMVDLSDSTITEEKQAVTTYLVDNAGTVTTSATTVFNNEYTIKTTGYAVFGKKGANILESMSGETALFSYALNVNNKTVTYEFFPLKTDSAENGVVSIGATAVSKTGATVQTYFADAINAGDTFIVRTPEQLAKIGAVSANFSQTHDIAVTDFTTASIASGKTYEGNNLKLSVSGQTQTWLSTVDGTVKGLNLVVSGGVNKPVFGTVGGTVTLSGLTVDTIGANGALAETVSGSMTVPAISTAAVSGKLFGDSTGTIKTGAITVNGNAATLFSKVANAETGGITVNGNVTGKVFGETTGTVKTGAISVTGTAAQIFGNVSGTGVTVDGTINVTGAAGQVFGTVGAPVEVKGAIGTGTVNTQIFGEVGNGTVTVNGNISVDKTAAHTGKIFNDVKSTVNVTGAISLGEIGENGQVFGSVTAPVTVGGGITTNGGAVSGQVFGAITLDASETVDVKGITVGKIAPGKSLIASVGSGNTANAGTVTVGVVSTQMVGSATTATEGEGDSATTTTTINPANIFGNINGGTVTATGISAGNVYGNIFGDITGGTVTTGSISVASLSGKLAGSVDGTLTGTADSTKATISLGTDVTLGNLVTQVGSNGVLKNYTISVKAIGASVIPDLDGTVQNVSVTADSATLSAPVLVADNDGSITNSSVSVGEVNITAGAGNIGVLANEVVSGKTISGSMVAVDSLTITDATGNVGIMVGQNSGTISGATVTKKSTEEGSTLTANLSGANVGGLVGDNTGKLTNNTVTVDTMNINGAANVGGLTAKNTSAVGVTGDAASDSTRVTVGIVYTPGTGGVTIGGLVGENSGTVNGVTVAGSIDLASGTGEGKSYIIGGAVGHDKGGAYTGVTSSVTVDGDWAGAEYAAEGVQFQNMGSGSVGMFVGVVTDGAFTNCASTVKSSYQFMGQIVVKTNTLNADQSIWFSNTTDKAETSAVVDYVEGQAADYSGKGYTRLDGGYAYNTYDATLSNCTFVYSDEKTYAQEIGVVDYFYLGAENKTDKYLTSRVNGSVTYTPEADVRYSDFGEYSGRGNNDGIETEYYVKIDGKEYPVFVNITRTGNRNNYRYTYELYYGENNVFHTSAELRNTDTQYSDSSYPLFAKAVTFPTSSSPLMYMVVTNGYALGVNGNRVAFKSEFEKSADADLYNAIWQSTGSGAAWTNLSNSNRYINPVNGPAGTTSTNVTVSVSESDTSLFTLSATSGYSRYYLRYRNNAFGTNRNSGSNFEIYQVNYNGAKWEATFALQNNLYSEQILPVLPAATALSEETIPADNGGETGNNT